MIWIVLGIMFLLFFGTGWIFHKVEKLRDEKKTPPLGHVDTCVCCGAYIPEGRMVCERCERNIVEGDEGW